eukprot:TRINITY_DN231_c1_g1_i1.p1 TRINITY_DN231_c1_g1~~TRINITY_DN231_c1_g1_i1.p1  ORF type:complete len:281 (+),score=49.54 TRINITY_DN231_c1_g1_i1:180-1022(+)
MSVIGFMLGTVVLLCVTQFATTFTRPDQLSTLDFFVRRLHSRSKAWEGALATWTCPTSPNGLCDPCSETWWGNWDHMHCRGLTPGKDGDLSDGQPGIVTNIHLSDLKLDGPIPRELCLFKELRELDLDGGRLSGPIPDWIGLCFPSLAELDISYNRLSGTIPEFVAEMKTLQEFEVRYNRLKGTIPASMGSMPLLRELEFDGNQFTGKIPMSFQDRNATMTGILLANNDFEGNLDALAGTHLIRVNTHNNPKLCGMVPASVRYAKGYNPKDTGLGKPCPQ